MGGYGGTEKTRQDLLTVSKAYSLVHSTYASINDTRDMASVFPKKFDQLPEFQGQLPAPENSLKLQDGSRYLFLQRTPA